MQNGKMIYKWKIIFLFYEVQKHLSGKMLLHEKTQKWTKSKNVKIPHGNQFDAIGTIFENNRVHIWFRESVYVDHAFIVSITNPKISSQIPKSNFVVVPQSVKVNGPVHSSHQHLKQTYCGNTFYSYCNIQR